MASYAQLQKQIEQLQKQAEKARDAEKADVVVKLRETIDAWGITAEELFGAPARKAGKAAAKKAPGAARSPIGVPKYQDPRSGKTWTGMGKPPAWIAQARDRSRFLIEPEAAAEEATPEQPARAKRKAAGKKVAGSKKATTTQRSSKAAGKTAGVKAAAKRPAAKKPPRQAPEDANAPSSAAPAKAAEDPAAAVG